MSRLKKIALQLFVGWMSLIFRTLFQIFELN